ncbi:gamma-glutamylcyclotransferase-like [Schistocerca piceifrons]|uniref:gamma-glutamylcyclotransferase-like n=1 Tax=Schistocerca piceifrons TaxID=274613 RepID=UPI001F5E48C1|nr:gamma-glutamylcyclotransferase-like [Schistocerca piceifrons]
MAQWFEEDDSCKEGNIFEDASSEESANESADVNIEADDSPSDNITSSESENEEPPQKDDKFLYFAYGSNLLAKRIHMNNPTAVRTAKAKLADYRLDFGNWSRRWKCAVATIVPDQGKHVWAAVWQIDKSDMDNLDR